MQPTSRTNGAMIIQTVGLSSYIGRGYSIAGHVVGLCDLSGPIRASSALSIGCYCLIPTGPAGVFFSTAPSVKEYIVVLVVSFLPPRLTTLENKSLLLVQTNKRFFSHALSIKADHQGRQAHTEGVSP